MPVYLLLAAIIILMCVLFNKVSSRLGIPVLFAFIALGMLFGSDGLVQIPFGNFHLAEQICSGALLLIMFYGGFGTNWQEARPVALKSVLLSTLGVLFTAGLTGLFCHFFLHFAWLESLLVGAVISSTDAASVFSVLRSKRLNLKDHTASMLELESGSNDPVSYMLTLLVLSLMRGEGSLSHTFGMVAAQIGFGILFGLLIAFAALFVLRHFQFNTEGFDAAFVLAVAIIAYALPTLVGGNGYLSVYLVGILLGNAEISNKQSLVHFFDGLTGLMQMLIFFLLGLLSFPSQLPGIIVPAVAIALFLTFVARPIAVCAVLAPTKCKWNQQLLVSWTGLRGAASIVFAIMAKSSGLPTEHDIFHIVFFIVLLSIAFQGTLISLVAKRLDMIDDHENVLKTFSDYSAETPVQFIKLAMTDGHPWIGKQIKEIMLPPDTLLVLILRKKERILPNGNTVIQDNDHIVLSALAYLEHSKINLTELELTKTSKWIGKTLSALPHNPNRLVIMIKRGKKFVIPNGKTTLREHDILVISTLEDALSV